MSATHTPGPWEFVPKLSASENHRGYFVRAEKPTKNGKWALAEVQPGDEEGDLGEANARLIAAAPDLLQALETLHNKTAELIAHLQATERLRPCFNLPALDGARDALAKATGSL